MNVNDPANINMENIYVDTDNLVSGFYFIPNCNYPEAYLTPSFNIDNITFYATGGTTASNRPILIEYGAPGNVTWK